MPILSNTIGDIGEMLVCTRLMESGIFAAYLLGGKVPAFDILAEIVPTHNLKPYQFLIQVKATDEVNPFTIRDHRLKNSSPSGEI